MIILKVLTRLPTFVRYSLLYVKRLYHVVFRSFPFLALLPYGGMLLVWNDFNGDHIFAGMNIEDAHYFVAKFLKPSMIMIDVGAHHGFYAVLASKRVGPNGKVIAFEPSYRERERLRMNLRLNHSSNVTVESFALSSYDGEGVLYVVKGYNTGCNSLRPPNLDEEVESSSVQVRRLESYIRENKVQRVDIIKIDAEGAELEILKGTGDLLRKRPRPVIVCEVMDVRTQAWGYNSLELLSFMRAAEYRWFKASTNGSLEPLAIGSNPQGTFVAIPEERLMEPRPLVLSRD